MCIDTCIGYRTVLDDLYMRREKKKQGRKSHEHAERYPKNQLSCAGETRNVGLPPDAAEAL